MHFRGVIKFCMNFFAIEANRNPKHHDDKDSRENKKMLIEKLIFVRECRRECEGHDGAASSDFKVPPIHETCSADVDGKELNRFLNFNISISRSHSSCATADYRA